LTGLSNGVHNVTVYAWDEAGNVAIFETMFFSVPESFSTLPVVFAFVVGVFAVDRHKAAV
jgi:hypothetical protein